MAQRQKRRTTAETKRLYEDLWIALGPPHAADRAGAEFLLKRITRTAETVHIRKIIDPVEAGVAGSEASKRYQLYEDGQSVADFIQRHGDGGHLRLDAQRGCIRLVRPAKRRQ